jgi:predicted MFS family arabinose efflux permease
LAAVALLASRAMLEAHPKSPQQGDVAHFAWPHGALLLIGVLAFAGMTAEGVLYDWSVLYLKQEVGLTQAHAALGYATFTASMALARFGGDRMRARFRERSVLGGSAAIAAVAMALVLLSANAWVAFLGLALVGIGLAPVAPILFNASTRVPGVSRAAAIAAVTALGYSGFLVGPPLIGALATAFSLTTALFVVVLAAIVVAYGARFVSGRPG